MTYKIIRFYQNARKARVMARHLSLKEAQDWCNDPETSSHTARKPKGCDGDEKQIERWNYREKHWFDGYEQETN